MAQARITGTTGAVFDFTSAGVSALSLQDAGVGPAVAGKLARVANRLQWHDAGGARDVALVLSGPLASQPAAGVPGRLFIATDDNNAVSLDTGTSWLPISAGGLSRGPYAVRGLVGQNGASPNTQYGYAADVVTLWRPSDQSVVVRSNTGTLTNDVTVAGPAANGRDQSAAFPASSWIHFYFIWNGTTLATLSSLTAPPTGPTLPTGYTHWAYAGAVRWNATPALVPTRMRGATMGYEQRQSLLTGGTATTETTLNLAALVPPNALLVGGDDRVTCTSTSGGDGSAQLVLRVISGSTYTAQDEAYAGTNQARAASGMWIVPNRGQTLLYRLNPIGNVLSAAVDLYVTFYTVPNGDA